MFRSPQILTLTCPLRTLRPLLLRVRDPASPEAPSLTARRGVSTCQAYGQMKRREETSSLNSNFFSPSSDCEHFHITTKPSDPLPPEAVSSYLPQDLVKDPPCQFGVWGTTLCEHSKQNPDCSNNVQCLHYNRRPTDDSPQPFRPDSVVSRIRLKPHSPLQSRPYPKHTSLKPLLVSSVPQPWTMELHRAPLSSPLTSRLSFPQTRALHLAAARKEAALRECLSLENEERCRQSLGPNLGLYEGERVWKGGRGQGRWASVLVSLCSVEGQPAFLFTLRSSTLKGRHKGDVSFAGGKGDPSDQDVVDTALREAREELGVTVSTDSVWGVLQPLRDMSGMMIAPVVANLGPLEALSFKPNPGEVEEIFTLSVCHVCSPENRGYTHFRTGDRYGYTLPVFRNGKHRVWGLTAVALDHALKLILPP
ncbi:nucleoside diphosphate-linked moiety X motif 8 isoform X2 [Hypomesus transpacificus]|uniref:nucleoside diphosphate-linked moiety X motif 8 isoform X2 n=1 Tax=Hypomesus transpacificus TaxID=137520 RepID=UPI001F0855C1|nr:nucleoside diphosphate-linked moiety X motif 8 isoform X2 [Hypomesus transpacificus]